MKFFGKVGLGRSTKWLDIGGDPTTLTLFYPYFFIAVLHFNSDSTIQIQEFF